MKDSLAVSVRLILDANSYQYATTNPFPLTFIRKTAPVTATKRRKGKRRKW